MPSNLPLTAEELERLPLEDRQRLASEALVTDLSQLSEEFLDRARRRGAELLRERGVVDAPHA